MNPPFLTGNRLADKLSRSPSNKSHSTPTEAIRELIRRAMDGKVEPEAYFQAVQLIREHGDFNLGTLFRAINQMEKAEETDEGKIHPMTRGSD